MKQTSYKHDKHRDVDLGKAAVEGVTGYQTLIEVRESATSLSKQRKVDRDRRSAYSG
jgi:hypothetical protein